MNQLPRRSLFDFDDLLGLWGPHRVAEAADGAFAPRVDVKDREDGFDITAELPGVKKEDLRVSLHNGLLTIEAESKQEDREQKDGKIIRQERRYGKYVRSFDLGDSVEDANISASFKDGILKLSVPKAKAKPPSARVIEVL